MMVVDDNINKPVHFSVSMCVYEKDDPKHFRSAVESILNQTRKPDEIVLVVDGPVTEAIDSVIQLYEENRRFVVVRLPQNQGHGNARRIGLDKCTNEIVALMDSDDISLSNRFEQQLEILRRYPDVAVVGGNIAEFIDDPKNIVGSRKVPTTDKEIKEYIKRRCPMNQVTVMFKKSVTDSVGGYIDWFCEEDYYLWLRLCIAGYSFANVDTVLVNVRVGNDMYKRRGGWRYFISEVKLQRFMLENKVISPYRFIYNVTIRFLLQVMMTPRIRMFVYSKFARE